MWEPLTYRTSVNMQPPLILELLRCLSEELGVGLIVHFDVYPQLVAR